MSHGLDARVVSCTKKLAGNLFWGKHTADSLTVDEGNL
jgi:hypothetical protein